MPAKKFVRKASQQGEKDAKAVEVSGDADTTASKDNFRAKLAQAAERRKSSLSDPAAVASLAPSTIPTVTNDSAPPEKPTNPKASGKLIKAPPGSQSNVAEASLQSSPKSPRPGDEVPKSPRPGDEAPVSPRPGKSDSLKKSSQKSKEMTTAGKKSSNITADQITEKNMAAGGDLQTTRQFAQLGMSGISAMSHALAALEKSNSSPGFSADERSSLAQQHNRHRAEWSVLMSEIRQETAWWAERGLESEKRLAARTGIYPLVDEGESNRPLVAPRRVRSQQTPSLSQIAAFGSASDWESEAQSSPYISSKKSWQPEPQYASPMQKWDRWDRGGPKAYNHSRNMGYTDYCWRDGELLSDMPRAPVFESKVPFIPSGHRGAGPLPELPFQDAPRPISKEERHDGWEESQAAPIKAEGSSKDSESSGDEGSSSGGSQSSGSSGSNSSAEAKSAAKSKAKSKPAPKRKQGKAR